MKFHMKLISASLTLLFATRVLAGDQIIGSPFVTSSPQHRHSMIAAMMTNTGLPADHSFRWLREHPGMDGKKIARFQHTYKGVPILGSESVVVTDHAGLLVSQSHTDHRAGLNNNGVAADFATVPLIDAKQAITSAVANLSGNGTLRSPPKVELMIFPVITKQRIASAIDKPTPKLNALDMEDVVTSYELVWHVATRTSTHGHPVPFSTLVNARTGEVLLQRDMTQAMTGSGSSQYSGSVQINTTLNQSTNTYYTLDQTRGTGGLLGGLAVINANHGILVNHTTPAPPWYYHVSSTNTWGDGLPYVLGGSTTDLNGQTSAVDAMWGAMKTYDMLSNTMNWRSLDGKNTAFVLYTHYDTNFPLGAAYDAVCQCVLVGDGNSFLYPPASIDVIAHEMGHGVNDATAMMGLVISPNPETYGLDESNSDIFGAMATAWAMNGGTGNVIPNGGVWEKGREISRQGQLLRSMSKPSAACGYDNNICPPDEWEAGLGSASKYWASGPNSRMFYLLSQGSSADTNNASHSPHLSQCPKAMAGLGNHTAFRLWFYALTHKFTSSTSYADARAKMLEAAADIFGLNSPQYVAVYRAYAAINVGLDLPNLVRSPNVSVTDVLLNTGWRSSGELPFMSDEDKRNTLIVGLSQASTASIATLGAMSNNDLVWATQIYQWLQSSCSRTREELATMSLGDQRNTAIVAISIRKNVAVSVLQAQTNAQLMINYGFN